MKKEELVELGLSENQIQEVFKINGQDIEKVKSNYSQLEVDKVNLENELTALKEQSKSAIDPEQYNELKAAKETLSNEIKNLEERHKEEVGQIRFDNALDLKLIESGAKSLKAVKSLLDLSQISYKDGVLEGIDKVLGDITKEHGYMFEESGVSKPKYTRRTENNDENKVDAFTLATNKWLRK